VKALAIIIASVLLTIFAAACGTYYALRAVVAPLHGEWSVPVRFGPLELQAGVPSLIRLATSTWGGPLLNRRTFKTTHGNVMLGWETPTRTLMIECAPCVLQAPGLGQGKLQLTQVRISVRRTGEALAGEVSAGRVRGSWQGQLASGQLRLQLTVPATPLADADALFSEQIPEVAHARIEGVFWLHAGFSMPDGSMTIAPRIEGFQVTGLGTEALAGARSSCGKRVSRLTPGSWLSRAVIAAEDQRFYEHPGYDLAELTTSVTRNQQVGRVERGASTLPQQLAKLLVTGDERSAVRKLREMLYAVEMERTLGKARILRLYLDNAPWGMGLCGAEAAAGYYFGVRAHELAPAQAVWLAAMLHNPQAEAQQWMERRQINVERAQWVALGMRGMSTQQKLAVARALPEVGCGATSCPGFRRSQE
jgi:hypothetical protein